MTNRSFINFSGVLLCLSGLAYILDTVLDGALPQSSPGLGALVPILGLIGFPGFWFSLRRDDWLALSAFGLAMLGLAGLVAVTFLNNRLFPEIPAISVDSIVTAIRPELLAIGLIFLVSALLLVPACWRSGQKVKIGAILYAAGAVPVSMPPLMPMALVAAGGFTIGVALLVWGTTLFGKTNAQTVA